MGSINRSRTSVQSIMEVVKTLYIFFGFPFLLFVSVVTTLVLLFDPPRNKIGELQLFVLLAWSTIIVPVVFFMRRTMERRNTCKKIFLFLKNKDFFDPSSEYFSYHTAAGKFIGIDINRGTVLYIHRLRKGQVDVIGMNVGDWTHREIQDDMLRLYTKFPELPRIEIATHSTQKLFDALGAMEYRSYNNAQPFSTYVNSCIEQLEREHNIHIPKLA